MFDAPALTSRCTSRPTAEDRSRCVDELRESRRVVADKVSADKTSAMRETSARLRANSVKNVPPVPAPPDVAKLFDNSAAAAE